MSMMLCPICKNELAVHNTAKINDKFKMTYSCVTDKILVDENGEIILTDFFASPNVTRIKERLSQGFDLGSQEQVDEFIAMIVGLVKYTERLEQQLKEKDTLLKLLRSADLHIKRATEVMEVNDE